MSLPPTTVEPKSSMSTDLGRDDMASIKGWWRQNGGTLALVAALSLSLGSAAYYYVGGGRLPWSSFPPRVLAIGTQLPATLHIDSADGRSFTLDFAADSRPTVLYILSPICEWCRSNETNIKTLVAATNQRFRYIGLSTLSIGLKEYVAQGHAPFPVYYFQSRSVRRELGIAATPETVVVSPAGKVMQVWTGAYMQSNLIRVQQFFHVTLPGISKVTAN